MPAYASILASQTANRVLCAYNDFEVQNAKYGRYWNADREIAGDSEGPVADRGNRRYSHANCRMVEPRSDTGRDRRQVRSPDPSADSCRTCVLPRKSPRDQP